MAQRWIDERQVKWVQDILESWSKKGWFENALVTANQVNKIRLIGQDDNRCYRANELTQMV